MNIPAKLKTKVLGALPKGATTKTRIFWQPTGLGKTHVLRVVTPAWKALPRWKRNHKLHEAIRPHLTAADLQSIFRISVLTPPEFDQLQDWNLPVARARRTSTKSAADKG